MARAVALRQLLTEAVTGNYRVEGNIQEADCIIALAMGFTKCDGLILPGGGNRALAEYIVQMDLAVPRFAQDEIAIELARIDDSGQDILHFGQAGKRFTGLDILRLAVREMKLRDLSQPVLVASNRLEPRAVAIARRLGCEQVIVPAGLPSALDRQSAQRWTRSTLSWAAKEPFVLVHHRVLSLA